MAPPRAPPGLMGTKGGAGPRRAPGTGYREPSGKGRDKSIKRSGTPRRDPPGVAGTWLPSHLPTPWAGPAAAPAAGLFGTRAHRGLPTRSVPRWDGAAVACVSPAPPFSPCFPPTPAPQPRRLPPARPPVAPGTVGFAQRAPGAHRRVAGGRPRFTAGVTPSRFRPALPGPGAAARWVNRAWCPPRHGLPLNRQRGRS